MAVSQYLPSGFTSSSWTSRIASIGYTTTREALKHQRETAQHALLHQEEEEELPAVTHQYEAVARQNHVSALARNSDAPNHNVQMQVRQLEQDSEARFSQKTEGTVIAIFWRSKSSSWRSARQSANGSNIRSMEAIRASTWPTEKTESSSSTRGRRYATTKSRICWITVAFDRIGSGNTAISRNVWRISKCPIGCWTRHWSNSTQRGRSLKSSTTSKLWKSKIFEAQ